MSVLEPTGTDSPSLRWKKSGVIGKGGQGRVFRVEDRTGELKGEFALKEIARTARRERIDLEILTTKNLYATGAPVLQIVDDYLASDPTGKRPWYVTPYVKSGNLRKRLTSGPYKGKDEAALEMCRSIVSAVKALHERRVAHRDLKPENVLVTEEGDVLLCDLGISMAIAEGRSQDRLTRVMEQIGSRHYMAPEALGGRLEAGNQQFALDVYAVGKIIYELIDGKTLPGIESHRSPDRILSPRNPDFDALVNRLLDGLLTNDPELRLRAWSRIDNSLRMLDQALRGTRSESEVDEWKEAELKLSAALARRHGALAGVKPAESSIEWQQIVNETCARTVERVVGHPGMKLIKYLVEDTEGLATVQAMPSGPHPRELLEGAYIKSHYGVDPLTAAGWQPTAQPASFRAFAIQSRDQKVLPSYWLISAVARNESRLRVVLAIVRKDAGDKPYIDVILGTVRVIDFDPLDLSADEAIWDEALPLVQKLFDQLLDDVTPSE